jgi:outer membrane lipopolysaccharide assembly protein LptE/RlpB
VRDAENETERYKGQVADRVERLETQITHQQSDENERLRRELRDAYIEIGQMRTEIAMLKNKAHNMD